MNIQIHSHTQQSFAAAIQTVLGKGHTHASLLYEEWFRLGTALGKAPAFKNAQSLLKDILALTDFKIPTLITEKNDGFTGKFLLQTEDKLEIESVVIPMRAGFTLCISSQIGCRMGCSFCETGRMGLLRNLTTAEIVSQLYVARFVLGLQIRNVVFMGMGEPLDNYEAVMQAFRVFSDPCGLGYGKNHITISTSGCVDGIYKLIDESHHIPNLAVSINAPEDELRNRLMPVNRKHNMQSLYEAMSLYHKKTGRQILIAYVLLRGQNDTLEHADKLAHYLQGLDVKINLIPYNSQSCERYQQPDMEALESFTQRLRQHKFYTLLRLTKGDKIMAACGQLGNLNFRKRIPREKTVTQ